MTFEDVQIRQAVTAEEGQKVPLAVLIAPDHRFNVRAQPLCHACPLHAPPLLHHAPCQHRACLQCATGCSQP